jgi:hypothetical protein
MLDSWWLTALVAGLIINIVDVATTLAFAAKPWNAVLASQGIAPSPLTPPYYVFANFVGGFVLFGLYAILVKLWGEGANVALAASIAIWFVTRLYGGGHVVMRQMPLRLFAIMSTGLGLGYLVAGQFIAYATA